MSTQTLRDQSAKQVMRFLGVSKMPMWLMLKLGHYPSMQDYEVASIPECEAYWRDNMLQHMEELEMSSSFDKLTIKPMAIGMLIT